MGQKENLGLVPHQGTVRCLREEAPAPSRAADSSLSPAALQLLLPSLCFMTCFMSTAWRLPRCHGNQPGAGSWLLDLGLAILSREPILRDVWGDPRIGICGAPGIHSACLPLCSAPAPRSQRAQEPCSWEIRAAGYLEGLGLTGK